jgi:hypothetical protein
MYFEDEEISISMVFMPTKLKISVFEPVGDFNVKSPSESVTTPTEVPLTITAAPGIGLPSFDVTFPERNLSCAFTRPTESKISSWNNTIVVNHFFIINKFNVYESEIN